MTVVLGGHLLLAPASIAAGAVATMLGLVLVRLAQQTARAGRGGLQWPRRGGLKWLHFASVVVCS